MGAKILVDPGEFDLRPDHRNGGFHFLQIPGLSRIRTFLFCYFKIAEDNRNLVEDVVAGDAGEQVELAVCQPEFHFCFPALGDVNGPSPEPDQFPVRTSYPTGRISMTRSRSLRWREGT